MGVVIPADYGLLSFHTLTVGDPEEMIWTVGCNLTSAGNPQDVVDDAHNAWSGNLADLTSSVVDLVRTVLKVGPTSTGATFENVDPVSGTNGGALPPPNCAVLSRKITALGGRQGRGRAYLPGISSISGSLDSSGTFSTGAAGDVDTAMNGLLVEIGDGSLSDGAPLVLLHSDSHSPTLITSFSTSNKLATQRRRLRP